MATALRPASKLLPKNKTFIKTIRFSSTQPNDNILRSVFKDVKKMNCTVNDFIWQNLDRWPDKTATVCAVTGHGYTYAQTHKLSVTFAASLRSKLKLQNDDSVAVIMPNSPEYPCVVLGIMQAGCVVSPMNPAYTTEELQHQLALINCKAIVATKLSYPNIIKALNKLQIKLPIILTDNDGVPEGAIKFAELAEDLSIDTDCLKSVHRSSKDVAVLPFSSGTTGFPKGVVLTHSSAVAFNQMIADPEIVLIKETTATYQAVLPAIIPFFHIFGFNALMMNQMHLGCKLVTMPYFKPELFIETIVRHKANVLFVVPPIVLFMGKHPAVTAKHLENIDGIICGAAPISETDIGTVIAKNKNINVRQGYGMTETNGGISIGKNDCTQHSAVGHILSSCEVKIADMNTHEALPAGEEGEVWFRGPNLMKEYYKDEPATREVMVKDGWYRTGDIGKYDDKKYLYITDRLKELIKVKGFQVPPAELESLIRTHPKILDCAVLGVPDPTTGESPKAFLVLQQGQTIKAEEILQFVNSKVADYKHLKEVQFVDEIPKNPAGKILRKDLKAKYC